MVATFLQQCREAKIELFSSVPDGYLIPLISALEADKSVRHVAAAREEECLGIAAGAAMSGRRAAVLLQNVGLMNSIGCLATLCVNYRTPFLIVISHRGNIFDNNAYDILKYQYFEQVKDRLGLFFLPWSDRAKAGNMVDRLMARAYLAQAPAMLLIDEPLARSEA